MALEALTCPKCKGEVDLDKDQEYGYCKYCGTKVQNTNFQKVVVTIKNDENEDEIVQKNLIKARRAFKAEDWERTQKHYEQVLDFNPENLEARFYIPFSKVFDSLSDNNINRRNLVFSNLIKFFSKLDSYFKNFNNDNYKFLFQIGQELINIRSLNFSYSSSLDYSQTIFLFNSLESEYISAIEKIIYNYINLNVFSGIAVSLYLLAISHCQVVISNSGQLNYKLWNKKILDYSNSILKLDPTNEFALQNVNIYDNSPLKNPWFIISMSAIALITIICILVYLFSL